MRIKLLIIALLSCLMSMAQTIKLDAPQQVVQGNRFQVNVIINNGQAQQAPKAPTIDNCTLVYGPAVSTSMSTEFINGQYSSRVSVTYTYTYRADKESKVTIPAINVSLQSGQSMQTKPQPLAILPPDKNAPTPTPTPDNRRGGESAFNADDMFIRISLNKSSVYEQEPVIATVKVYTRANISMFRIISQPTFEGFLSEELSIPDRTDIEHVNGKNYTTRVLKRCILYPQKSGKLTINSGKYEVTLTGMEYVSMGYFPVAQRVEKNVTTESNTASVTVKPLPQPQPASFNGAVGKYSAEVSMTPLTLRTNESSTYTYTIKGSGNIKYLRTPDLQLPHGIDQYSPQTDIDADFNGSNIAGTYTAVYTLVPQEPGKFEIPMQQFTYFDPADEEYKTIDLESFTINVSQGATLPTGPEQKVIQSGMTDIHHIKASTESLTKVPEFVFLNVGYWMLYLLCACILLAVIIIYRRHLRLQADVRGRKLAGAGKQASRKLKAARKAMDNHNADAFYAEINKALFGYLGDKLGIPASQLVRDNISQELESYGADAEQTAAVIAILDDCEMARFTPQHSDAEMSDIYQRTLSAIKGIQNVKPNKRK